MLLIKQSRLCKTATVFAALVCAYANADSTNISNESIAIPSILKKNNHPSPPPLEQLDASDHGIVEENIPLLKTPNKGHKTVIETTLDVPKPAISTAQSKQSVTVQPLPLQHDNDASYVDSTASKLGAGMWDLATSFLELPKTFVNVTREKGLATGLTIGVAKGIANTAEQSLSGAANIATFPVPKNIEIDLVENPGDEFHIEEVFGAAFGDKKSSAK